MIIDNQTVHVKIGATNMKHYKQLGYSDIKIGDTISTTIDTLTRGSHAKVNVQCDYCGMIFQVTYRSLFRNNSIKQACNNCRLKKASESTLEERRLYLFNNAQKTCAEYNYTLVTSIEDIKTAEDRVIYICPKHGKRETKIYTLLLGHKCLECSYEENACNHRKTPDEVYNDIYEYGGILLNKEEYISWNTKNLKVICPECNEIFITSYCAFTQRGGQVCPKCSSTISKGERKIKSILESNNLTFHMQHRFDDCRTKVPLPFDFYLPIYNMCIEYDGEGHFMPIPRGYSMEKAEQVLNDIKTRDKIKTEYCDNNNIKLIRIPYWDYNNIENILDTVFT